jgi:hypothetical protein
MWRRLDQQRDKRRTIVAAAAARELAAFCWAIATTDSASLHRLAWEAAKVTAPSAGASTTQLWAAACGDTGSQKARLSRRNPVLR